MGTVLIVDDDRDHREVYAQAFSAAGFDVLDAHDGIAASSLLSSRKVDALVVDVCMPGLDGIELTSRGRRGDPTLVIVVVSAHVAIEMRARAMAVGADAFCLKPCLPDDLVKLVRAHLRLGSSR